MEDRLAKASLYSTMFSLRLEINVAGFHSALESWRHISCLDLSQLVFAICSGVEIWRRQAMQPFKFAIRNLFPPVGSDPLLWMPPYTNPTHSLRSSCFLSSIRYTKPCKKCVVAKLACLITVKEQASAAIAECRDDDDRLLF